MDARLHIYAEAPFDREDYKGCLMANVATTDAIKITKWVEKHIPEKHLAEDGYDRVLCAHTLTQRPLVDSPHKVYEMIPHTSPFFQLLAEHHVGKWLAREVGDR